MVEYTEEVMQDSIQVYEAGKYCPTNTEEILNIINEESGAYFSGDKGKDEVIHIIQNRVQLLLDEYQLYAKNLIYSLDISKSLAYNM